MPYVELKSKTESFESLLRRWKKAVEKDDTLKVLRKYEAFERPGDKKKRAKAAAVKRQQRLTQEMEWMRLGIKPPTKKEDDKKKKWSRSDNE
jgi:small subunit ribosomal protein S21